MAALGRDRPAQPQHPESSVSPLPEEMKNKLGRGCSTHVGRGLPSVFSGLFWSFPVRAAEKNSALHPSPQALEYYPASQGHTNERD